MRQGRPRRQNALMKTRTGPVYSIYGLCPVSDTRGDDPRGALILCTRLPRSLASGARIDGQQTRDGAVRASDARHAPALAQCCMRAPPGAQRRTDPSPTRCSHSRKSSSAHTAAGPRGCDEAVQLVARDAMLKHACRCRAPAESALPTRGWKSARRSSQDPPPGARGTAVYSRTHRGTAGAPHCANPPNSRSTAQQRGRRRAPRATRGAAGARAGRGA